MAKLTEPFLYLTEEEYTQKVLELFQSGSSEFDQGRGNKNAVGPEAANGPNAACEKEENK